MSLKDTNKNNQANQQQISNYIQNTISLKINLIEQNHSKELAFTYFE